MRYRGIVIIAFSLAVGAFGLYGYRWLKCGDRMVSYYPTQAVALASGDAERSWLPEALPAGATQIHEEHDLDTNEVWLRFSVAPDEARHFVSRLRQLSAEEVAHVAIRYPCDDSWWFAGLIEQEPANDPALNAEVYEGVLDDPRLHVFVAIDRLSPTVYYWAHLAESRASGSGDCGVRTNRRLNPTVRSAG